MKEKKERMNERERKKEKERKKKYCGLRTDFTTIK
jgi:hypothetical protein